MDIRAAEISRVIRDQIANFAAEEEVAEERRALEILNRAGSALAAETDLQRLVQIVNRMMAKAGS